MEKRSVFEKGLQEKKEAFMASNPNYCDITPEIEAMAALTLENSCINPEDYARYDVKRACGT